MNKRNGYRVKKKSKRYGYRTIAFMLAFVAILGAGWVGYQFYSHPNKYPALQAFSTQIATWWTERKAHIQAKLAKPKAVSHATTTKPKVKNTTPEPIHFEFYTMLPNGNGHANNVRMETKQTASGEKNKGIFNSNSLEQEFAKDIAKKSYVVHTGMYSNLSTAEKTREMLAAEGLATKVVKAYMADHLVYRVQMGPYEERNEISEVQSKLAAHGLHTTIHQIEDIA